MELVTWRHRRAERALERQWAYQRDTVGALPAAQVEAQMRQRSTAVKQMVDAVATVAAEARVLEVGCGSRGLIFNWDGTRLRVGLDPLAVNYASLFAWHRRVPTCAAAGERLPFADQSFDLVICDNVIDHAERPDHIVREVARVLRPGGVLFFSVNVHHPVYRVVSWVHAAWTAAGVPVELAPFADHTVHLTLASARRLIHTLPIGVRWEDDGIARARLAARQVPARHLGDRLKRLFFKNARYQVVAVKNPA